MDEHVVCSERAGFPLELGSVIGGKYTILRLEKAGLPDRFVCREDGAEPLRSVWAFRPRHRLDPRGEAFLAELARVAKLVHPQLQKVLDFGRDPSGVLYSVYEPIELRNIADVIEQDRPLADERVVWLMCQLLATLEAAHAEGVVHGDVRPENVLVRAPGSVSQNEEILLCGLGLAGTTRFEFSTRTTRPQLPLGTWIVGTPQHAAPEQLRGAAHDARSDVYAAGLLLFQMLTRTVPFTGANDADTAFMQCFTPPPPPSGYGPVNAAVEAICLKALAKTPELRYQSVNELRGALLEAQAARTAHTTRLSRHPARGSQSPAPAATARTSSSALQRVSSPGIQRTSSPGLSHRGSSPSVPAVTRVATWSKPGASTRGDRTSAAPGQTPRSRHPSASLLLTCSALAIAAALILPDLKLGETDADAGMIVRGAPAATSTEDPLPVEPAVAPAAARTGAPTSAAGVTAPAAVLPPASAPRVQAAKPTPAFAAAPSPRRAQPPLRTVDEVEPTNVRVHAVKATASAADAPNMQKPVVAIIARLDEAEDSAEPATAPSSATITTPAASPSNRDGDPVAAVAQASERATPQPTAAPVPSAPVAAEPAAELPRPMIVLANTAPKSPSPSAPAGIAHEVRVFVGEASFSQGAGSKNGLRSALNQSALARCYLDAAQSGNPLARNLQARLELGTNMAGRIVAAKLSGSGMPASFTRCVEDTARLGRVRDADTGEARATLELSFVAH